METKSKQEDIYYTIENPASAEIKIKSSRFIANASPAANKETAMNVLEEVRARFHDASHNCFAYKIGKAGNTFRYADDGEPTGTAGKPILFAINKFNVSDIVIVVTRYFGGTRLGVGGLARAYNQSANEVLSQCTIKPVYITTSIRVFCTYEDIDSIKKLISAEAISFKEIYHDAVEIIAEIPNSKIEEFTGKVTSLSKGRAGFVIEK